MTDIDLTGYRVAWRSRSTGATGHGDLFAERDEAELWMLYGRRVRPELDHWVEVVGGPLSHLPLRSIR